MLSVTQVPICLELLFGARESRTGAHPRLPEKICHHIYSETTELVETGRPRARNGENKSAKIQKMLIFIPYPRYKQTEDRPAQCSPLHAGNSHPVGTHATGCAPSCNPARTMFLFKATSPRGAFRPASGPKATTFALQITSTSLTASDIPNHRLRL